MAGLREITLILLIHAIASNATTTTKEIRTAGLPEKIIGGVIEIVHSHKNKPAAQQNVQQTYPNQGYQPQYPQYQQWNGQSTYQGQQGQGFNYHGQYQNQGQYGNYQNQNGYNQGTTYPQNTGNYNTGQSYPSTPVGSFSNGQTQTQGQYQAVYQNQNQATQPQYGTTGQYQNNQQSSQQYPQNPSPGNFQSQNQNTGNYQVPHPSNNLQGQNGSFHGQGESGGQNQSFQVSGGHQASANGGGPTCVCQAWTKPSETLNDPAAEKIEKMSDPSVI